MQQRATVEANGSSDSQEVPRTVWNPNVHYRGHKTVPIVPIPNNTNQVHTLPPYFLKALFNIILASTHRSFKWSLSFRFPNQKSVWNSLLPKFVSESLLLLFTTHVIFFWTFPIL